MNDKMVDTVSRELEILKSNIMECTKCDLHKCGHVPFKTGTEFSIMIIGVNPGQNELIFGEPFVGRSGKYLSKLLLDVGLDRKSIYMTNICKCGSPKNRNPKKKEITSCIPWLVKEIELVQPKLIITCGRIPTEVFLNMKINRFEDIIGDLCTNKYLSNNNQIKILPTYHPSFCIRHGKKYDNIMTKHLKLAKDYINGEV